MKKLICFGLLFLLLVGGALGYKIFDYGPISEQQFLSYSRSDFINNLNLAFTGTEINREYVRVGFAINSVEKREDEYWIMRKGFDALLETQLVIDCLDKYTDETCYDYLINYEDRFNVVWNGKNITISPIYYQVKMNVLGNLQYLLDLQEQIRNEDTINDFLGSGTPDIPGIT